MFLSTIHREISFLSFIFLIQCLPVFSDLSGDTRNLLQKIKNKNSQSITDFSSILNSNEYAQSKLLNDQIVVFTNKNLSQEEKYIFDELQKTFEMNTFDFLKDKLQKQKISINCFIADALDDYC